MTMASLDLSPSLQGLIGMQGLSYSLRFLPSLILISDVLDAATRFAAWLGQYHLKPRGGLSTEPQPHWLLCIVLAITEPIFGTAQCSQNVIAMLLKLPNSLDPLEILHSACP